MIFDLDKQSSIQIDLHISARPIPLISTGKTPAVPTKTPLPSRTTAASTTSGAQKKKNRPSKSQRATLARQRALASDVGGDATNDRQEAGGEEMDEEAMMNGASDGVVKTGNGVMEVDDLEPEEAVEELE